MASSGQTKPERKIKGTDDGIKIKKQHSLVLQTADNVCPKNAIHMEENKYGFVFPKINENLCVKCGACKKVCSYQKENNHQGAFHVRIYVPLVLRRSVVVAYPFFRERCGLAA